ncbi:MAG TPA: 2-C-methyl-D-erythritol 4-phosphate cytidylyltransferase [Nitrospiria bacterium]
MKTTAIIVAAGVGKRMRSPIQKPFIELRGRSILAHTLLQFEGAESVSEVVLVVSKESLEQCEEEIIKGSGFQKVRCLVPGGETRQESVYQGLIHSDPCSDIILVHDGVRPFVSQGVIRSCIEKAQVHGGALAALPIHETVKQVGEDGCVEATVNREILWRAQTPQVFQRPILEKAHREALAEGYEGTDEASLVERLGISIQIVEGEVENIKITTPEDLALAEFYLKQREGQISVEL